MKNLLDNTNKRYYYGPDRQRCKTELSRNDTLLYTRYYADNYEEVHEGNNVYRYYYVYTPDGLSAVAEKKNTTMNIYSSETDYLGSIVSLYNTKGKMAFRAEYDAWGRQNVVVDSLARFQRGYCGHEHWHEFDLVDMNGRMYDPVIARFLSPDPFVQAPEDLQNYNRYSYCLNNPLKYSDPSGESIVAGAVITVSAIMGGFTGYSIGHAKEARGWEMAGYIVGGMAIGGVSGWAASAISAAGGVACWAGCGAGAINGAGFSYMVGGKLEDICKSTAFGALSGLAGGWVGSAFGGGLGAFAGGVTSNLVNQTLYTGFDDINWKSVLLSGLTSSGIYYGMSWASWRLSGRMFGPYQIKYGAYLKLCSQYQRSRCWHKEYGGYLMDDGSYVSERRSQFTKYHVEFDGNNTLSQSQKAHVIALVHTHWDTNGKTYYFQGNKITKDQYDIYSEWGYECSINETHLDFSPGDRQIQGNLFLINRIHSGLHTNIGGQTTQEVYFQDYFLRFFLFSNF